MRKLLNKKIFLSLMTFVVGFCSLATLAFAQDVYKVTFSYNGTAETFEINAGDVIDPIETPTKEGYTFYRWINQATQDSYDFSEPVNRNLVLQAQWKKVKGADMTNLIGENLGNLSQEHITHVNPNEEFGLTRESFTESILSRLNFVALGIALAGVVAGICFAVVWSKEKKRVAEEAEARRNKVIKKCHKCGEPCEDDATICLNCGARLKDKNRKA